jgi:UDP-GlcNAc3NAcA epimerase
MKLLTVVGARPQFIKAAALARAVRDREGIVEVMVHTGQHHDDNMSKVFFEQLEIPEPHRNLGIAGGSHGAMTGRMLEAVEAVLVAEAPDWVLVYGDTNSTLAGALAAAKLHLPVAHVEAGLRSWNRRMPEEINRVLTDHLSSLLFAPTGAAVENLLREGIDAGRVHLVGDVMFDAARHFGERSAAGDDLHRQLGVAGSPYVLATVHRAENTDDPARMQAIIGGLSEVARALPVVLPLHPRTRAVLQALGLVDEAAAALRLCEPLGYLDMTALERGAAVVVTDSGGVQKEAFFHRVPCVTLRHETEWVELIEHGWNTLCPPEDASTIATTVLARAGTSGDEVRLYGDGQASRAILDLLLAGRTV